MGNPRKPSALKLLQGNPGKRALPKAEPQPPAGAQPPKWLDKYGLAEWRHVAPLLETMRVLTIADCTALAIYCSLVGDLVQARQQGKGTDPKLAGEIRQYLSRFGLTPADRSRVSVRDDKPESKLQRFVAVPGGRGGR